MTGEVSNPSVIYPWPHLNVLRECSRSAEALAAMRVDAFVFPGWAPTVLAIAVMQLSIRPGATLSFAQQHGFLRIHRTGGTSMPGYQADDVTSSFANRMAGTYCEICGRPGRLTPDIPSMVLCDADWSLRRGHARGNPAELRFDPRMPLLERARVATVRLYLDFGWANGEPPFGWAPALVTALRNLRGIGFEKGITFPVEDTHLSVEVAGLVLDERVARIAKSLARETAITCRQCGRRVPGTSAHPGMCDGCDAVRLRGWSVVPAPGADR